MCFLFVRFFNFLRGYVFLGVRGFFLERFLNLCLKKDICLWDVKYGGENSLEMKMSINGLKKCAVRHTNTSEVKNKKEGGTAVSHTKIQKTQGICGGIFNRGDFVFRAFKLYLAHRRDGERKSSRKRYNKPSCRAWGSRSELRVSMWTFTVCRMKF